MFRIPECVRNSQKLLDKAFTGLYAREAHKTPQEF